MKKIKVLIVLADFYQEISRNLLENAIHFFESENVEFQFIRVPGALEISQAIKFYYDSKYKYESISLLGLKNSYFFGFSHSKYILNFSPSFTTSLSK